MARIALMDKTLPCAARVKGSGIYGIINVRNGKIYVGSAIDFQKRRRVHSCELSKGVHHSRYLQRAYKLSPQDFQWEIIEFVSDKSKLVEREQFWMDFYRCYHRDFGYNSNPIATSCAGLKHPPEYGEAISRRQKGVKWSDERKARTKAHRPKVGGWKWSEGQKMKHSLVHMGWKPSPAREIKRLASLANNPKAFNRKGVLQMDDSGNVLRHFKSIAEAESLFGKRSNIHAVCKGKRPQCFGYKWSYC